MSKENIDVKQPDNKKDCKSGSRDCLISRIIVGIIGGIIGGCGVLYFLYVPIYFQQNIYFFTLVLIAFLGIVFFVIVSYWYCKSGKVDSCTVSYDIVLIYRYVTYSYILMMIILIIGIVTICIGKSFFYSWDVK